MLMTKELAQVILKMNSSSLESFLSFETYHYNFLYAIKNSIKHFIAILFFLFTGAIIFNEFVSKLNNKEWMAISLILFISFVCLIELDAYLNKLGAQVVDETSKLSIYSFMIYKAIINKEIRIKTQNFNKVDKKTIDSIIKNIVLTKENKKQNLYFVLKYESLKLMKNDVVFYIREYEVDSTIKKLLYKNFNLLNSNSNIQLEENTEPFRICEHNINERWSRVLFIWWEDNCAEYKDTFIEICKNNNVLQMCRDLEELKKIKRENELGVLLKNSINTKNEKLTLRKKI